MCFFCCSILNDYQSCHMKAIVIAQESLLQENMSDTFDRSVYIDNDHLLTLSPPFNQQCYQREIIFATISHFIINSIYVPFYLLYISDIHMPIKAAFSIFFVICKTTKLLVILCSFPLLPFPYTECTHLGAPIWYPP